jgi:hypothetical protein
MQTILWWQEECAVLSPAAMPPVAYSRVAQCRTAKRPQVLVASERLEEARQVRPPAAQQGIKEGWPLHMQRCGFESAPPPTEHARPAPGRSLAPCWAVLLRRKGRLPRAAQPQKPRNPRLQALEAALAAPGVRAPLTAEQRERLARRGLEPSDHERASAFLLLAEVHARLWAARRRETAGRGAASGPAGAPGECPETQQVRSAQLALAPCGGRRPLRQEAGQHAVHAVCRPTACSAPPAQSSAPPAQYIALCDSHAHLLPLHLLNSHRCSSWQRR